MVRVGLVKTFNTPAWSSDHTERAEPVLVCGESGDLTVLVIGFVNTGQSHQIDGIDPVLGVGSPHVDFFVVLPDIVADLPYVDSTLIFPDQHANPAVDFYLDSLPFALVGPVCVG